MLDTTSNLCYSVGMKITTLEEAVPFAVYEDSRAEWPIAAFRYWQPAVQYAKQLRPDAIVVDVRENIMVYDPEVQG